MNVLLSVLPDDSKHRLQITHIKYMHIQAILTCQSFHFQELFVNTTIVILCPMQHTSEMLKF